MNQSLVDDFLVLSDKIGSANFFWSFPSKAYQDQVVRRDTMRSTLVQLGNHTESLNRQIQEEISNEINQAKIGKTFKVLIDRKESGSFIGRTEHDSPEVDNEVYIDAKKHYLRVGDFAEIKITDATEFDLYGEPAQG